MIVPLFAELERSMTNKVKIFQVVKNHPFKFVSALRKLYFHVEDCNGKIHLTEVFNCIITLKTTVILP